MEFSFTNEKWIPNYVEFLQKYNTGDMFLSYLEEFVKPFKRDGIIYFLFNFGEKTIEVSSKGLENLLYELKENEGNLESEINVIPKELADFLGYFNLIDKTKKGFVMIEESIKKIGDASLATLLGHVLIEKHFPKMKNEK